METPKGKSYSEQNKRDMKNFSLALLVILVVISLICSCIFLQKNYDKTQKEKYNLTACSSLVKCIGEDIKNNLVDWGGVVTKKGSVGVYYIPDYLESYNPRRFNLKNEGEFETVFRRKKDYEILDIQIVYVNETVKSTLILTTPFNASKNDSINYYSRGLDVPNQTQKAIALNKDEENYLFSVSKEVNPRIDFIAQNKAENEKKSILAKDSIEKQNIHDKLFPNCK